MAQPWSRLSLLLVVLATLPAAARPSGVLALGRGWVEALRERLGGVQRTEEYAGLAGGATHGAGGRNQRRLEGESANNPKPGQLPRFSKSSDFDTMDPDAAGMDGEGGGTRDGQKRPSGYKANNGGGAAARAWANNNYYNNNGDHEAQYPSLSAGGRAGARGGGGTCAVVFRSWGNPGPELMARAERWATSLSLLRESDNCDLWISIDETREQVDRQIYNIAPDIQGPVSQQVFHQARGVNMTGGGGENGENTEDANGDASAVGGDASRGASAAAAASAGRSGSQPSSGMSMAVNSGHSGVQGDGGADTLGDTLEAAATKLAGALGNTQKPATGAVLEGNTGADFPGPGRRRKPRESANAWFMHRYSMRDMATNFPVLISLDALCHDSPNIPDSWCRVWPKIFQTEAILLWWRAARDNNFVYSHVWVVQDDVEYTGDPGQFLTSDDFRGYDLVTPHAIHPIVKDHTARQITVLSNTHRLWFGSEGVRRYSARLLDVLEQRSKAGESAWSEFSAPTICRQSPMNCRFTHFPRDVISQRFNWEDNTDGTILTADELADMVVSDPAWQDVWVHKVWNNDARKKIDGWGAAGSADHGVSLMVVILILLASVFAVLLMYSTGLVRKPSPRRFLKCKKLYPWGGEAGWRRALVAEGKRIRDAEAQKKIDAAKRDAAKLKDPEV